MPANFVYDANLLCLDLVNTRQVRDGEPVDLLPDFAALVAWLEGAGLVKPAAGRAVLQEWEGTAEARAALHAALELREAVNHIADDMRAGRRVRRAAVETVNAVLALRPAVMAVEAAGESYVRAERPVTAGPATLLGPVAESAVELLVELDPGRVGKCSDPDCILYFYDTTKNHGRRWCSMERCGNRAKAAAHYDRVRRSVRR